jgi:TPR repeat protein
MKGSHLGGIAALLLAPLFAMPVVMSAEADPSEIKETTKKVKKKKKLSKEAAEQQYQQAKQMEGKGDEKGALRAYLVAGNAGHGLAQKRLGEIYEKGNSATKRDYDTALRWYEKARAQGIEIPKPITLQKGH